MERKFGNLPKFGNLLSSSFLQLAGRKLLKGGRDHMTPGADV